jgi:hypothetical protein
VGEHTCTSYRLMHCTKIAPLFDHLVAKAPEKRTLRDCEGSQPPTSCRGSGAADRAKIIAHPTDGTSS